MPFANMTILWLLGMAIISAATDKILNIGPHDGAEIAGPSTERTSLPTNLQQLVEKRLKELSDNGTCVGYVDADSFTDEDGNPTDSAGYVAACLRWDADIERYGQAGHYLRRATGVEPENMRFEVNHDDSEDEVFAHAYSSRTCTGDEPLASIGKANVCYSARGGLSVALVKTLPSNCIIQIYPDTPDCTDDYTVYGTSTSELQCYEGMSFESIKLVCASFEPSTAAGDETRGKHAV
jgi:hypothetical protein